VTRSTQGRIAAGLAVLVVAAAAVLVWLWTQRDDEAGSDVTSAAAEEASVASADVMATVLEVADEAATRVYSYSWKSLADDKAAARDLLTGDMVAQYDRTIAGVASSGRRDRRVVSAEVVGTALVHATTSYARVLVFVNQSTQGRDLASPRLDLDRVLVTLRRVDGGWKVSELDAL
jgi:Mce-associated membrane protein